MKKMILILSMGSIVFSGCAKVNFNPTSTAVDNTQASNDPTTSLSPLVCGTNQVKVQRPTRILFVVDQSGSNVNGPYEAPGAATDPTKSFRTKVMQQFYQANQTKNNLSWGLTVFNNGSATNLMTNSSNVPIPFSPLATDFNNALNRFKARSDLGETPYRSAISMIKQAIAQDLLTAPKYVYYLVAFMTDGYPTDYCPLITQSLCPGQILEDQINSDVQSIVNLANSAIQFSTVYYGKPDSDASKRLQRMATIGQGQYIDTNQTVEVKLNDVLDVDQEVCVEQAT